MPVCDQVKLREITVDQVDAFRTWLMNNVEHGGNCYAQNYVAMVYAFFSSTLDNAVWLQFLTHNVCYPIKHKLGGIFL